MRCGMRRGARARARPLWSKSRLCSMGVRRTLARRSYGFLASAVSSFHAAPTSRITSLGARPA
eukprot:2697508-Prymnesium_polylepis.1